MCSRVKLRVVYCTCGSLLQGESLQLGRTQASFAFRDGGVKFKQLNAFIQVGGRDAPLTRFSLGLPVGDLRWELHF